ncbi:MAG: ABC transporter ATP-binding protein [Clostridia bacterium]|nr:ABC transporter ATP-binding protein [Clostridia bacterium]
MNGMPGGPGGPRPWEEKRSITPPPKSIREVPDYLCRLLGGFFKRLFYIYGLVWETKPWILFLMLFMAVFNGVMPIIGSLISRELINLLVDAVQGAVNDFKVISGLLTIQFVYMFARRIVNQVDSILTRISGELVSNHIKLKIINKAKTIDTASFDTPEFYQKLENANREAGNRPIQILNSTFSIMSTVISMISYIMVLAVVSRYAPLIIVLMSVPSAIINFIYRRKNADYMFRRSKERRKLNYFTNIMTSKDHVKEVRMYGMSDLLIGKYKEVFATYFNGLRKLILSEGAWHIGLAVLTTVVNCVLYIYIAQKVFLGELEVGDYSLYTGALSSIASGVATLVSTTATIYEGTLFIDNMMSFMEEEQHIVPRLAEPLHVKRGEHVIEFDHVSFRYPNTDRDVIRNVSFTLNPRESVVLVGLNGAGKTTLLKLLTRLYDPTEGRILLDGQDLRDYDVAELYKIFGIIFQDFGRYAFSVRENISFGDLGREIDDERIRDAAGQSGASEFIERLPDQYYTPLMRIFEDNGLELSGGQWQKLAIARAFYSDSDVMILDEPTAALDAMAEQEIYNEFDALSRDKTTIFVSHRLSSATRASKILVLEYGQLIEEGTHEELMAKGGRYCELFSTQASRYIVGTEDYPPEPDAEPVGAGRPPREPHPGRHHGGHHEPPPFGG